MKHEIPPTKDEYKEKAKAASDFLFTTNNGKNGTMKVPLAPSLHSVFS